MVTNFVLNQQSGSYQSNRAVAAGILLVEILLELATFRSAGGKEVRGEEILAYRNMVINPPNLFHVQHLM